jgi:hypothetical protein
MNFGSDITYRHFANKALIRLVKVLYSSLDKRILLR